MACPKCGGNDTWDDNFWSGCNKCKWSASCEHAFSQGRVPLVKYTERNTSNSFTDDDED